MSMFNFHSDTKFDQVAKSAAMYRQKMFDAVCNLCCPQSEQWAMFVNAPKSNFALMFKAKVIATVQAMQCACAMLESLLIVGPAASEEKINEIRAAMVDAYADVSRRAHDAERVGKTIVNYQPPAADTGATGATASVSAQRAMSIVPSRN